MIITEPLAGIVHDLDELEYHAMPGLSATGMKAILRSPKHYRQTIDHRVDKPEYDLGHIVHAKVLGTGLPVIAIPDEFLSKSGSTGTNAAKDFITEQRAAGKIPVKGDVVARADAIAEAVLTHPKAATLLALRGNAEVSLFANDPETGVALRGRIDWLGELADNRVMNVDVKTTTDVRRHKIVRAIEDYGYDIQSEAYKRLLRLLGFEVAPTHLIFVETDPPHEVRVIQLAHEDWIDGGARKMRLAIDRYAHCLATDHWPGDDDTPGMADPIEPRPYYLDDIARMEDAA